MAKAILCDGCGESLADYPCDSTVTTLGIVVKRDYCQRCAKIAQAFLDEEETLRKLYYDNFLQIRKQLIATYSVEFFLLPDVAEKEIPYA